MRLPNTARVAAVLAGSTVALVVASGAPAAATTTVAFPDVPTMAYGGLCWTSIHTWADTSPDRAGPAVGNRRAAPGAGVWARRAVRGNRPRPVPAGAAVRGAHHRGLAQHHHRRHRHL